MLFRLTCASWWSMRPAGISWCTFTPTSSRSPGPSSTLPVSFWVCSTFTRIRSSTGGSPVVLHHNHSRQRDGQTDFNCLVEKQFAETWNWTICCWTQKATSKLPILACAKKAWATGTGRAPFAGHPSSWLPKCWLNRLTRGPSTGGDSAFSSSRCSSVNHRSRVTTKRKSLTASSTTKSAIRDSFRWKLSPSCGG